MTKILNTLKMIKNIGEIKKLFRIERTLRGFEDTDGCIYVYANTVRDAIDEVEKTMENEGIYISKVEYIDDGIFLSSE